MESAISIAGNISRLRKEAGLTQEDLASHLGVTKASVSKWETGQSYPDIELLPKIAAYFDISIDSLVGYAPQMGKSDIKRECARLRTAFATQGFAQAHEACQQLAKAYYSCYPLLTQIATLYLNHMDLAPKDERKDLTDEAIGLCQRIRRNSKSSADVKMAEGIQASFLLASGNPEAAIQILGSLPEADMGTDLLLSSAYSALGRPEEADTTLQGALLQSTLLNLNRLTQMAMLYIANPAKLDVAHERARALIDAFNLDKLYLNAGAVHVSFATAYTMSGNAERALDCLEDYARAIRYLEFPVKLHGDDFFDRVEGWLEDMNPMGRDVFRDEALVKKSMLEGVTANPVFTALSDQPRFKRIVTDLKEIAR